MNVRGFSWVWQCMYLWVCVCRETSVQMGCRWNNCWSVSAGGAESADGFKRRQKRNHDWPRMLQAPRPHIDTTYRMCPHIITKQTYENMPTPMCCILQCQMERSCNTSKGISNVRMFARQERRTISTVSFSRARQVLWEKDFSYSWSLLYDSHLWNCYRSTLNVCILHSTNLLITFL